MILTWEVNVVNTGDDCKVLMPPLCEQSLRGVHLTE